MLTMVMLILSMQGLSPQNLILQSSPPVVLSYNSAQDISSVLGLTKPEPKVQAASTKNIPKKIVKTAKTQIGVRYRWGGTSRNGFDCSGFVQYVFRKHDIRLPRTSIEQSRVGKRISRSKLNLGDLIFFRTRGNRVSHVGIYKGNNQFIHASSSGGKIRVNVLSGYYAQRYVGARRVL
jgi:cell wall-associated NlpC family hydrolase